MVWLLGNFCKKMRFSHLLLVLFTKLIYFQKKRICKGRDEILSSMKTRQKLPSSLHIITFEITFS